MVVLLNPQLGNKGYMPFPRYLSESEQISRTRLQQCRSLARWLLHHEDTTPLSSLVIIIWPNVFANGPGDRGSIPGRVIPKTQKIVLDAALLSTQHYRERIKGKVEQSMEWSSTLPYTSMQYLLKREPPGHSRLRSQTFRQTFANEELWLFICGGERMCRLWMSW